MSQRLSQSNAQFKLSHLLIRTNNRTITYAQWGCPQQQRCRGLLLIPPVHVTTLRITEGVNWTMFGAQLCFLSRWELTRELRSSVRRRSIIITTNPPRRETRSSTRCRSRLLTSRPANQVSFSSFPKQNYSRNEFTGFISQHETLSAKL